MRIMVAEDNPETQILLKSNLEKWGYDVTVAGDGESAWNKLQAQNAPPLVLMDWMMPGMDGLEVCRRVRGKLQDKVFYIILLTAKSDQEDIIAGLQSGADDFLSKPFNMRELQARIKAGERVLNFQLDQVNRVDKLHQQLMLVKELEGFLSICAYCKKIHAQEECWESVESYISKRLNTKFSHTICPPCYEKHVEPELKKLREEMKDGG